jgi:DNA-binding transcriptional ArsR family regulator
VPSTPPKTVTAVPAEVRWLRAVAHPLRLRILSLVAADALTAAEVARELGLTHANASYHLRQLLDAGHVEVGGEERIRGGRARRYRYVSWDDRHDTEAPTRQPAGLDHLGLYAAMADELRRRSELLRPSSHNRLTDIEAWITDADLAVVAGLLDRAVAALYAGIQPRPSHTSRRVSVTLGVFEIDPDRR